MKKLFTILATSSLLLFSCSKDDKNPSTPINSDAGELSEHSSDDNTAVTESNKTAFLQQAELAILATLKENSYLPGSVINNITEDTIIDDTITIGNDGSFDCVLTAKVRFDSDESKAFVEEANLVYTFYNYKAPNSSLYLGGQQGINLSVNQSSFGDNEFSIKGQIIGSYRFNGKYASESLYYGVLSYQSESNDFKLTKKSDGSLSLDGTKTNGNINNDLTFEREF